MMVVAPERQRSAASHAITLHKPLRLTEVRAAPVLAVGDAGRLRVPRHPQAVRSQAGGRRVGHQRRLQPRQRRLLLGHRRRGGRGRAARRGGHRVLARAAREGRPDTRSASPRRSCSAALAEPMPAGTVLNVNMPGNGSDALPVDHARPPALRGRRRRAPGSARPPVLLGRRRPAGHDDVEGTDCVAVARGWNSITPMHLDLTDRGRVAQPPWALEGFRVMVGSR